MNHILVVDDNPIDRQLVRALLEKHTNYHVEFASDGIEALEHLEVATPLLVVSDLNMPGMDGLALVKQIRHRFPTVPVVLMTAFGSEESAVEAMVQGAADYVAKHRLSTDLLGVVESVMSVASENRRHDQVTQFVSYKKLRYELPHDVNLIPTIADHLQQEAAKFHLVGPEDQLRLAKSLVEAMRNAVVQGGASPTQSSAQEPLRPLIVEAEFTPTEATFTIRDQGPGFDATKIVDPRRTPTNLTADPCRSLTLIQLFMDEVRFNATGNEIVMVKRRR